MSVNLYDEAVLNKFKGIFYNTVYAQTDMAFQASAELDKNQGKMRLPLFSIYCMNYTISLDWLNWGRTRVGRRSRFTDTENYTEMEREQTVPMRLEYQLDVWASTRSDLNDIVRELLFWIVQNPTFVVENPLNGEKYNFNLYISSDLQDNSDVMTHESRGRIYRMTIPLMVDEAVLFKVYDIKTVLEPLIEIEVVDDINELKGEDG